jgi:hypothetical protein
MSSSTGRPSNNNKSRTSVSTEPACPDQMREFVLFVLIHLFSFLANLRLNAFRFMRLLSFKFPFYFHNKKPLCRQTVRRRIVNNN